MILLDVEKTLGICKIQCFVLEVHWRRVNPIATWKFATKAVPVPMGPL